MSIEDLTRYWALIAASVIGLAIALFVVYRVLQDSRRGRLAGELRQLEERRKARSGALQALDKARARLGRLQARAESAPPRRVEKAQAACREAEEDLRLIDDQLLIVGNRVRTIILEDYPPKRQAAMRRRFLGEKE